MMNYLTKYEKNMINAYRRLYGPNEGCSVKIERFVETDKFLETWKQQKADLFKLFGNKLMITEKGVKLEASKEILIEEMRGMVSSSLFYHSVICEMENVQSIDLCNDLFNSKCLVENKYSYKDGIITLSTGQEVKVPGGCRPLKILGKIAQYLKIEKKFEAFRNKHSEILNKKTIKGDLVLSIHPMDYLTMSDNSSNWRTCMSWREDGCYSSGTLEMMNSPYVIVAYLKSNKKDFYFGESKEYSWTNKKWRQLFIVNERIVTGIKQYPLKNTKISKWCRHKLVELASAYFNTKYIDMVFEADEDNEYLDDSDYFGFHSSLDHRISFRTDAMYNDFQALNKFTGALSEKITETYIDYSYTPTCACCGKELSWWDIEELGLENNCRSFRVCADCLDINICEHCGHGCSEELIELDGEKVCQRCLHRAVIPYNDPKHRRLRDIIHLRGRDFLQEIYLYRPLLTQEVLNELFVNATLKDFENIVYWNANKNPNSLVFTKKGAQLLG